MAEQDSSGNGINLRTLRRSDPTIESIIDSASQVAIYKYSTTNEYQKLEVEGSLFICSRNTGPRFGFTIINRLTTTNMSEIITESLELMLEPPYMLYKNDKSDIFCVWFYNKEECARIYQKLVSLKECQEMPQPVQPLRILSRQTNTIINAASPGQMPPPRAVANGGGDGKGNAVGSGDVMEILARAMQKKIDSTGKGGHPQPQLHQSSSNGSQFHHFNGPAQFTANTPPTILSRQQTQHYQHQSTPMPTTATQRYGPSAKNLAPKFHQMSLHTDDNNSNNNGHQSGNQPISMEELKQTLINLLKNDADFLHKIHTTYVSSIQKK